MGRFVTPDWSEKPQTVPYAVLLNPQSLNLYLYVDNNPESLTDPDGHLKTQTDEFATTSEGGCFNGGGCAPPPPPPPPPSFSVAGQIKAALDAVTKGEMDFIKIYAQELASNIPFSNVASPSASNGTEKAAVGFGIAAGFAVPDDGEASRAGELANVMGKTKNFVTIAVTETKEGVSLVSSSENTLRPAVRAMLGTGEVAARGAGHAEVTGVNAARQMGLTPTRVTASRPVCSACLQFLRSIGVIP